MNSLLAVFVLAWVLPSRTELYAMRPEALISLGGAVVAVMAVGFVLDVRMVVSAKRGSR